MQIISSKKKKLQSFQKKNDDLGKPWNQEVSPPIHGDPVAWVSLSYPKLHESSPHPPAGPSRRTKLGGQITWPNALMYTSMVDIAVVPLQCVHILKGVLGVFQDSHFLGLNVEGWRFELSSFKNACVSFNFSLGKNAIIHGFYPKNQRLEPPLETFERTNLYYAGVFLEFFKMTPLLRGQNSQVSKFRHWSLFKTTSCCGNQILVKLVRRNGWFFFQIQGVIL